jgi:hypothetical protein
MQLFFRSPNKVCNSRFSGEFKCIDQGTLAGYSIQFPMWAQLPRKPVLTGMEAPRISVKANPAFPSASSAQSFFLM